MPGENGTIIKHPQQFFCEWTLPFNQLYDKFNFGFFTRKNTKFIVGNKNAEKG
jgi:hypothetical protein